MTQLELPQLSLQRYVDLLKRRRWQVIPVSLLGLVIGGIVAFFIPRYYVADAVLSYWAPSSEVQSSYKEDPFAPVVDSAKLTIPTAIEKTVKLLGWEEGQTTDPYELRQNLDTLESRLSINDQNASKGRQYARIQVVFRDREGVRAAAFVNTLVDTWIAQRVAELKLRAEDDKATATKRYNELQKAYDQYLDQKSSLVKTYGIDPRFDLVVQQAAYRERMGALEARKAELAKLQQGLVGLREKLLQMREKLDLLPMRLKVNAMQAAEMLAKNPEAALLALEVKHWEDALENYADSSPRRRSAQIALNEARAKLQKLLGASGGETDGMIPNPERVALQAEIEKTELELRTQEKVTESMLAQTSMDDQQLQRLGDSGFADYERLEKSIAETQKSLAGAHEDLETARARIGKLNKEPPVTPQTRAQTPPRPTEPNIMVVALIGCVLGLGLAISLILLLDVMQGSFKTLDDVERGLAVPVLGGVSHLETVEERLHAVRSRRRVTLVSAAVVVLLSGVVILFYWDPTRLPSFVRDLLAMVLGAA